MGLVINWEDLAEQAPESAEDQAQYVRDMADPEPKVWYVAVYAVSRNYGGPEEGGWWWDSGELIDVRTVEGSREDAWSVREGLAEKYPTTKKRYSVLGGEDHDILIRESMPASHFPDQVPHYE